MWRLPHATPRDTSRSATTLLACLNHLLLTYGQDMRASLPLVARALHPYLRRAWAAGGRQPRLREALVCYCRVMLQLGALQQQGAQGRAGGGRGGAGGGDALGDVLQLVVQEFDADGFKWWVQHVPLSTCW